jgi:hypothetical protein
LGETRERGTGVENYFFNSLLDDTTGIEAIGVSLGALL